MVLSADSFWLRIAPLRPVSLVPDDLNDSIYEVCGEIVYDPWVMTKTPSPVDFKYIT